MPLSNNVNIDEKQVSERKSFIRLFMGHVTFEMSVRNPMKVCGRP